MNLIKSYSIKTTTLITLQLIIVIITRSEKTEELRQKSLEQGEDQQQMQPIYGTVTDMNPAHIGGR